MTEYHKPLPRIDEDSGPFWEAAKRHEFVIQKCRSCGSFYYPASICFKCDNPKMEWVKASGKGEIYTWTIFHQPYNRAFRDDLPYNVAIIKLDEGPFFLSNIVECSNEDLRIGMAVQVVFEDVTDEVALPKFRPVA